jgi:hypothetical protein
VLPTILFSPHYHISRVNNFLSPHVHVIPWCLREDLRRLNIRVSIKGRSTILWLLFGLEFYQAELWFSVKAGSIKPSRTAEA